jgi:YVTN family beta-propeller protein
MSERSLPANVLTEIDSPIREARLAGVEELLRLVYGADLAVAAAARRALERLTSDDSRSVAAAAVAALERTTVRLTPDNVDFGYVAAGTTQLVADVLVEGPPLATATATVTVSGPGLHAALTGRQLRIVWQPRTAWLDGSVTVRGKAGWADVRVTGQVTAGPMAKADVEERLWADDAAGPARVTVISAPPARRRARVTLLAAGLAALVLGGTGVAVAVNRLSDRDRSPVAAVRAPAQAATPIPSAADTPTLAAPVPDSLPRVPAADRVASVGKPAVVGTVRVGAEPEGVAVSPDGRTVYVANQSAHVLSVVDAVSRRVTSVSLRHTPRFVTTSRDGSLVFVSMYEQDMSGSGVAVLDAASHKVVRYLMTGVQPYTLAVGPDDHLWVPIHSQHRIEIYTTGDQRPVGQVRVPPNPHAVGFSAKLRRAFTSNHESNAVSIIDMRRNRLVKSIPVSRAPHSIAVSPDGRTVLVAGYEANTADLIDAATLRRTGPFRVGSKPQSVTFAVDGRHAYVVNEGDNTVSVLNGHTGAVTATVRVGRSPRTIAVSPDGRLAYVSNGDADTITILRVGT